MAVRYAVVDEGQFHLQTHYSGATVAAVIATLVSCHTPAHIALIGRSFPVNGHVCWMDGLLARPGHCRVDWSVIGAAIGAAARRVTTTLPRTIL
jgi:hypothetical protein